MKICNAHDCSNQVYGRQDKKFCSERCKQTQKRYRKENGIVSAPHIARVKPTGDIITDVATNAANVLFTSKNTLQSPLASIGNSAMNSCVPYAIETVRDHPFRSMVLALGGYKAIGRFLQSCTTSTTVVDGKTQVTKSCTSATALQRSGGAAAAVILGNAFIDFLLGLISDHMDSHVGNSDTAMTRVKPVSDTGNTGQLGSAAAAVLANLDNNYPNVIYRKAN